MSSDQPTIPMGGLADDTPITESILADVRPAADARPDTTADPLLGTQLGNYEVSFVLGKGAYGAVYKARDVKLGRFVAIKFLHDFTDKQHESMFLREAKAIAALGKHPSIVQIFEWSEYEGRNYFVLEFVGSNAAMLLRVHPNGLPVEKALRIAADCASGLEYAHKQNIIHRDVKPANVLLEIEGGGAKLADFGVAKLFDPASGTMGDTPGGTPAYMAPEIVRGGGGDNRSDIFSLGATLYELLSGRLPFPGRTSLEVMENVRHNRMVPLQEQKGDLPSSVYALVERALAHAPEDRFDSGRAFIEAVEEVVRGMHGIGGGAAVAEDGATLEQADLAKTRAFKVAEDAKRIGAEKLANGVLAKGVSAFRDGEAHERLRQYGPAISRFDEARKHFLGAEEQSRKLMTEIHALKAAQGAMEEARAHADLAEAQQLASTRYRAAADAERVARKTSGLRQATKHYLRAHQLYEEALAEARSHGESALIEPRKRIEDVIILGEDVEFERHAPDVVAAARALIVAADDALPDYVRAQELYRCALEKYEEGVRLATEKHRIEGEQAERSSIKCSGIEFVWVPPGSFRMGSSHGSLDEKPIHDVDIGYGFWMGKYPVTQGQWKSIMSKSPSGFRGRSSLPVENVSWLDCQSFIERLNATGEGSFRLPTEAEWEYACRAGATGQWCFGDDVSKLDGYAWHPENAGGRTHPVGEKLGNGWGLHDMHGNVSEWCLDHYHSDYRAVPDSGAAWLDDTDREHVLRGGSWCTVTPDCRSAYRGWYSMANTRTDFMGFRVCRDK